jgi:hypothetical protein
MSRHGWLSAIPSPVPDDSAWSVNHAQVPIYHLRRALREQPESSETSSSGSSNCSRLPNPNPLPPVYQTPFDAYDIGTPDLIFSEHSTLSIGSDLPPPGASEPFHRHDTTDFSVTNAQLERLLDINSDGSIVELCDEPDEYENYDRRASSGWDRERITDGADSPADFQVGTHNAPQYSTLGWGETSPYSLHVVALPYMSQAAPSYPFNTAVTGQKYVPVCGCHGLSLHLAFPRPASGEPNNVCALYTSQISPNRQALPRRVEDEFEAVTQTVRKDISRLESHIQFTIARIFETAPTVQDGLGTLTSLHTGTPGPTLQGLVSLALLTKCTLLLQDERGPLSIHDDLFRDEISCLDFIQADVDKQAYVLFIQLLWLSSSVGYVIPEGQRLFCPAAYLLGLPSPGPTTAGSSLRPMQHSARICDGLVDGKNQNHSVQYLANVTLAIHRTACNQTLSPSPTSDALQSFNAIPRFHTFIIADVTGHLARYAKDSSVKTTFGECSTAVQKGHLTSFEEVEAQLAVKLREIENAEAEFFVKMLPEFMDTSAALFSVLKIGRLMDVLRQSAKGGLVAECSQCHQRFSGEYRAKNLKLHKERSCAVTKDTSDYQRFSCSHCKQTFTRMDNRNSHVRRHHTI